MDNLLAALNRFFAALAARLRKRRLFVWGFMIALSMTMGAGVGRLQVDMTMESFFFEDDPVRLLYERFKETFDAP